jgi:hypothetical protein
MSNNSKEYDVEFTEKVDISHIEGSIDQPTADDPNHRITISAEEKKLIRKIDWKVLPWLCVIGFLQFTDKVSLTYASVLGIIPDTHLKGAEYGALATLFYAGYLTMQVRKKK